MQRPKPLSCADAPLFKPTAEQWEDPLRYISLIRPLAEQCGLARIQPPESWQPPFVVDRRTYRLRPRIQEVHGLQQQRDTSQDASFAELYRAWLVHQGRPPARAGPQFQGREIDLARLYRAVCRRGGFAQVPAAGWGEVARILQVIPCLERTRAPQGARAGAQLRWLPRASGAPSGRS